MATKKKTPAKKPAARPAVSSAKPVEVQEPKVEPQAPANARLRVADVDLQELVRVKNMFGGGLFYQSKEGFVSEWKNFGDECIMTVGELLKMRNQQPAFFTRQWVLLVGDNADEVMNFLQIEDYLQNIVLPEDFDTVLASSPQKIKEVLTSASASIREALVRHAYGKYKAGELDSVSVIRAIKEATGTDIADE